MNLSKGEDYELHGTTNLRYGLRWEPVNAERKGLLGRAERKIREQQGLTDPADWDAGVVLLTDNDPKKLIGFGDMDALKDEDTAEEKRSVVHSGDSIRGEGDGDDESVDLDLRHIPARYNGILLIGGAFKKGAKFDAVRNVKATLYDGSDGTYSKVGEYEPSLLGASNIVVSARLDRTPAGWDLTVVGDSYAATPGDLRALLRGALRIAQASARA